MVNKIYAMSSFLQFKSLTVCDEPIKFSEKLDYTKTYHKGMKRKEINTHTELHNALKKSIEDELKTGRMALMLSGGMDSAILAKFVPKGTFAYTVRCIIPGKDFIDESLTAKHYCEANGLEHKVIDLHWEDYVMLTPALMKNRQAPVHAFDLWTYKVALQAKTDGFDKVLTGEGADEAFGGLNMLLSKDYTFGEFVERFSSVMPYKALKESVLITEPFKEYCMEDGYIDVQGFLCGKFFESVLDAFRNACETAGITYTAPYALLKHELLDLDRIRRGENKYLVRELFKTLYPNLEVPNKLTPKRPMDEWLKDWEGPKRPEFWKNCCVGMNAYQKQDIWMLEKFLNEFDI